MPNQHSAKARGETVVATSQGVLPPAQSALLHALRPQGVGLTALNAEHFEQHVLRYDF